MDKKTIEAAASPGRRLRAAWSTRPIAVPGVFNALVARMAERLGYQAVYLSGAALSAAAGVPDVGLLALNDFVEAARSMGVRIDLDRLPEPEPKFAEVEGIQVLVARMQPEGGFLLEGRPRMLPPRGGRGKFLGPRHARNESARRHKKTCPRIVLGGQDPAAKLPSIQPAG